MSELKRKRQDFSQSEKEIFMDIIKNSNGGELFQDRDGWHVNQ